jgi:hypothetical protein
MTDDDDDAYHPYDDEDDYEEDYEPDYDDDDDDGSCSCYLCEQEKT